MARSSKMQARKTATNFTAADWALLAVFVVVTITTLIAAA